jgi:hypothetical protein
MKAHTLYVYSMYTGLTETCYKKNININISSVLTRFSQTYTRTFKFLKYV